MQSLGYLNMWATCCAVCRCPAAALWANMFRLRRGLAGRAHWDAPSAGAIKTTESPAQSQLRSGLPCASMTHLVQTASRSASSPSGRVVPGRPLPPQPRKLSLRRRQEQGCNASRMPIPAC